MLNNITKSILFVDTGKDREEEDLSSLIFKDIEYNDSNYISFYRSDFRGSKFTNITFYKNNFKVADFINNHFKNVEFSKVSFNNTEIKNCFFEKCIFDNVDYHSSSFYNCLFVKTTFENERFSFTMDECEFIDCKFTNCIYDQCSTDNLKFDKCSFLKCEMSTMHAENFKIKNCIFRDTYLGLPFLGTYLVANTDFNLLQFKYRGKVIDDKQNLLEEQIQKVYIEQRFFEYLNYLVLFYPHNRMIEELSGVLNMVTIMENKVVREYNLRSIFEMIEFYLENEVLTLEENFAVISILQEYNNKEVFLDKFIYECLLYKLIKKFEQFNFTYKQLKMFPTNINAEYEIRLNVENEKSALDHIDRMFKSINKCMFSNQLKEPLYKINSIRKGSYIVDISSMLLLCLMIIKLIREANRVKCRIQLDNAVTKNTIRLIENNNSLTATKKAFSIIDKQFPDSKISAEEIHRILGNDSIISIIVSKIFR